jgi:hypothetical protein
VIEVRPILANLSQLAEVRREFAGDVFPSDVTGGIKDSSGFILGVLSPEIAQKPRAQPLRLPDIEDAAGRIEHLVDPGPVFSKGANPSLEFREVGGRKGNCALSPSTHD